MVVMESNPFLIYWVLGPSVGLKLQTLCDRSIYLFATTMTGLRIQEINRMYSILLLSHMVIYNLKTIFIRCKHTCSVIHIRTALSWIPLCWPIPPPASLFCPLPVPLCKWTPLFTYLEISFLVIVVRMSIHTLPQLVIDCPPLAPQFSPSPPNSTYSSCYMFTETTSQHQLHCLLQYPLENPNKYPLTVWQQPYRPYKLCVYRCCKEKEGCCHFVDCRIFWDFWACF